MAEKASVLLVDRSRDALLSLRRVLERKGYRVRCARSSGGACQLLEAEPFDVVVTDWLVADGEATEVAAHAKDKLAGCRVIVLTEYARGWYAIPSNDPNVDALLPKPYDPAELLVHLERLAAPEA